MLSDNLAVILHSRPVGSEGVTVPGLLVTSLLPESPKMLLNVETGDYAELSQRECGCALGRAGLHTHLAGIRSFEKLTGEGMTFVGTEALGALPTRFLTGRYIALRIVKDDWPALFASARPRALCLPQMGLFSILAARPRGR